MDLSSAAGSMKKITCACRAPPSLWCRPVCFACVLRWACSFVCCALALCACVCVLRARVGCGSSAFPAVLARWRAALGCPCASPVGPLRVCALCRALRSALLLLALLVVPVRVCPRSPRASPLPPPCAVPARCLAAACSSPLWARPCSLLRAPLPPPRAVPAWACPCRSSRPCRRRSFLWPFSCS